MQNKVLKTSVFCWKMKIIKRINKMKAARKKVFGQYKSFVCVSSQTIMVLFSIVWFSRKGHFCFVRASVCYASYKWQRFSGSNSSSVIVEVKKVLSTIPLYQLFEVRQLKRSAKDSTKTTTTKIKSAANSIPIES